MPAFEDVEKSNSFVSQLEPYLLEAPGQAIAPSPFLKAITPSPWETLTFRLTDTILTISNEHTALHDRGYGIIQKYLGKCLAIAQALAAKKEEEDDQTWSTNSYSITEILTIFLSLLGFISAITDKAYILTKEERYDVAQRLKTLLSDNFLTYIEGALSSVRNFLAHSRMLRDFEMFSLRYAKNGCPLGAMLLRQSYLRFLLSCSALEIATVKELQQKSVLDYLLTPRNLHLIEESTIHEEMIELLAETASEAVNLFDEGADYLELGSMAQQKLAFKARATALTIFLVCMTIEEEIADIDLLMVWLENSMADPAQMADTTLATTVLKILAIVAKRSQSTASGMVKLILRLIVRSGSNEQVVLSAARCLATVLQLLSQDAVITGIYSLGNVLSARSGGNVDVRQSLGYTDSTLLTRSPTKMTQHTAGSAISLGVSGDEETVPVYDNVVRAIVTITRVCADEKITSLALSMLLQKLGRVSTAVDLAILSESAHLGLAGSGNDLRSLLKLYDRLAQDALIAKNRPVLDSLIQAWTVLALEVPKDSQLYQVYLLHLLETIVSKGDVPENSKQKSNIDAVANEMAILLKPLALLAPYISKYGEVIDKESTDYLQREVWFNLAVHGITPGTAIWEKHRPELLELARYSKPLILEDRTDRLESDIDLNTVLRRGHGKSRTDHVKEQLSKLLPGQDNHIKSLSYAKVTYILAAYSVEILRADIGHCAEALQYFMDPICKQDDPAHCLHAVANEVMTVYLRKITTGMRPQSIAGSVAIELGKIFVACCHRNLKCQEVAHSYAERIITSIPSALCQRASLFALLELLTIMWVSCLDAETQEYEVRFDYTSILGKIHLQLSDDFHYRRMTLNQFRTHAKRWLMQTLNRAPLDTRGLLQTYLSEYDDDGSYGHVSLGRSFALEIGTAIPVTDHKLEAISRQDESNINTGSDFIAQYTVRQEYKYAEALLEYDQEWQSLLKLNSSHERALVRFGQDVHDSEAVLEVMERRATEGKFISTGELRDVLRRAAALVCRSKQDHTALVQHLVRIPFAILTKQSIKLGISIWLGVINENPRMETRVFGEIIQCWEEAVRKGWGVFDRRLQYLDPFFVKQEFAPSDMPALIKRQQAVNSLISPHRRILQFLISHFNASRLGSPHLRRSIHRLVSITLEGLLTLSGHPLLREFHFEIISFGLAVLHLSEELGKAAKWRLKDRILSAGLAWFANQPRWTFGGNRLQAKAEIDLIGEIEKALEEFHSVSSLDVDNLSSLATKQDLLVRLLEDERSRLFVWLFPLGPPLNHTMRPERLPISSFSPQSLVAAWDENPSLAIQIALRAQSPSVTKEVRNFILRTPVKVINQPEAIQMVLDDKLSKEVNSQLRFLLYWAPVNPITAATFFLPAFANHPFVIQYAMRALESHSVDVTFFYVPQMVQALRYDSLGYVSRYIVETAQFSQLFAHQIIWNMKANAYKDDDSQIPDPIKPTLDQVMNDMISSFSGTDKQFYQREFTFFDEITGISGKIREILHKSKPEKKAKIEEELHKITLEVGVYLPSNPDGVVVGIDRKSGKPLQSHAKAPYMATFRIRKARGGMEDTDKLLEDVNTTARENGTATHSSSNSVAARDENTYEVWQSAIFKVGDDCRQDVLALQMIAAFRGIFNSVGLDCYVYPYRVTATAPGCGVIDVLPKSVSRDMLGRETVNGLYEYFVSKYGTEESIAFQQARLNFVKSMAAYSVISYLLQFKDRHNGNIMIDDEGHILHIDFGFCFDIAPGGVRFERAPFKLTSEMVAVMGGTRSQSFRWFEELCIKAFLVSRPYTEKLCHMIKLMIDSGLPCFKPETINHFRERMVLEKKDREAADFMRGLISKSWHSYSTKGYDQFQLLTNGIPY